MRQIIVHYHIFKNAGTSIDIGLEASFGSGWHNFDVHPEWGNIPSSDLLDHLVANPNLQALSSHQARWPEPSGDGIIAYPIVFLRHPIDRVGSMYRFGIARDEPGTKGFTLAEYVDRLLEPDSGWVGRSFQTLFLSDDDHLIKPPEGPSTQATEAHFDQAIRRLQRLPTFGMVERFQDSIARLNWWLAPTFPRLALLPFRANASDDRGATLTDRIDEIHEALGDIRYQRLESANEADLELWSSAVRLFNDLKPELLFAGAGRI